MNMGVKIKTPAMRMKHSGHTDIGAEMFWINAKIFQRAAGTGKKKVINEALMIPGKGSRAHGQA